MRYLALCCDYDGTLARGGRVPEETIAALHRLLGSGRRLVMVTGRELGELQSVFAHLELFERVVAENGALLYVPATREERALGAPPPQAFIDLLHKHGVDPLSVGRVIVATRQPHEKAVLQSIRDLGLELQVVFNKGAVMVLPTGINKASGLAVALHDMGLSPHNAVGIGDAENDHAFLSLCEASAAVANALPSLKECADFVTPSDHGAGVVELIEQLVVNDLALGEQRLVRHHIPFGTGAKGEEVCIKPYGTSILLAGTSGSGKSTVAIALLERLAERGYTYCVIDPEGDYGALPGAVTLGTADRAPDIEEVLQLLCKPGEHAVVSLVGLPLGDRPSFFLALLPKLLELRARTGRPHWLVVDEFHHLLPSGWEPGSIALPPQLDGMVRITVHPGLIAPAALAGVNTVIGLGRNPAAMMQQFAEVIGEPPPTIAEVELEPGEALLWRRDVDAPQRILVAPSHTERRRHTRKYAEGELPPERSFYFRGPGGRLNLRASNLFMFLQIGDGVDDRTWLHHLHKGHYSRWFRDCIKDVDLARGARAVETAAHASAADTRKRLRELILERYTLPADTVAVAPSGRAAGAAR